LIDLKSGAKYNGCTGMLLKWEETKERFVFLFDENSKEWKGKTILVLPKNIEKVVQTMKTLRAVKTKTKTKTKTKGKSKKKVKKKKKR
jgi:hypothetical protein